MTQQPLTKYKASLSWAHIRVLWGPWEKDCASIYLCIPRPKHCVCHVVSNPGMFLNECCDYKDRTSLVPLTKIKWKYIDDLLCTKFQCSYFAWDPACNNGFSAKLWGMAIGNLIFLFLISSRSNFSISLETQSLFLQFLLCMFSRLPVHKGVKKFVC